MAKPRRSGLGRGFNSILGGSSDPGSTSPIVSRTTNREKIVYDAREDRVIKEDGSKEIINDGTQTSVTGKFPPVAPQMQNVSRETPQPVKQATPIVLQEEVDVKDTNVSRETLVNEVIKEEPQKVIEKKSEEDVSRETSENTDEKTPENNVSRETTQETVKEKPKTQETEKSVTKPEYSRTLVQERPKNRGIKKIDGPEGSIFEVDIDLVEPNPDQPRTSFKEEDLKELSNSIKREGVIQPILVRQADDGKYQIIAGERRWQASKLAGKSKVPIQVKNVSDEKAIELALIENIQRTDLNPIEEAYGYKRLMERNQMTQADIAQAVSKGRSTIANALRLLDLPEEAQQLLFEDKITAGHARAILSVPNKEDRITLTNKLADKKLSVRETEALARLMANKSNTPKHRDPVPAVYKSVARSLKSSLGTNVKVKSNRGKNKIEIEFEDEKDLERIFEIISPE